MTSFAKMLDAYDKLELRSFQEGFGPDPERAARLKRAQLRLRSKMLARVEAMQGECITAAIRRGDVIKMHPVVDVEEYYKDDEGTAEKQSDRSSS